MVCLKDVCFTSLLRPCVLYKKERLGGKGNAVKTLRLNLLSIGKVVPHFPTTGYQKDPGDYRGLESDPEKETICKAIPKGVISQDF